MFNHKIFERTTQEYDRLHRVGLITIPIKGSNADEADEAKHPAIKQWQLLTEPLTDQQITMHLWRGNDGIAILCGRGLAVLDFDKEEAYHQFAEKFPDIVEHTYIVLSGKRQLPHVYFRYDTKITLKTRPIRGLGDLKAEGSYVVTAPTKVEEFDLEWTVKQGTVEQIVFLSPKRLDELQQWLDTFTKDKEQPASATPPTSVSKKAKRAKTVDRDYVKLYLRLRDEYGGRNDAYFRTLLFAQKNGDSELCRLTAGNEFLTDTTNGNEPLNQRLKELNQIEESALKYREVIKPRYFYEVVCQHDLKFAGMMLATLWSKGYGGKDLTVEEIRTILKNWRYDYVRSAVEQFLHPVISYSLHPVDIHPVSISIDLQHKQCNRVQKLFETEKEGMYRIPDKPETLALLPDWALSDPTKFKMGVLFKIIAEEPKHYTVAELASRIKVSDRSVQNYIDQLVAKGLITEETGLVTSDPITVRNVGQYVKKFDIIESGPDQYGRWIQIKGEAGRKPPVKALVIHLLLNKMEFCFVKQVGNHYQAVDSNQPTLEGHSQALMDKEYLMVDAKPRHGEPKRLSGAADYYEVLDTDNSYVIKKGSYSLPLSVEVDNDDEFSDW